MYETTDKIYKHHIIIVFFGITCDVEGNGLALVGQLCAATENGSAALNPGLARLRRRGSHQQPLKKCIKLIIKT